MKGYRFRLASRCCGCDASKRTWPGSLALGHRCCGARQLEAHHDLAEFAALNEIDWRTDAADFPELGIQSDEQYLAAVEAEGGLLILCDRHHRGPRHRIHAISHPGWTVDRWATDDWEFTAGAAQAA